MVCHKGGYPTLRHSESRDLPADLLKEVCHNTCIEPVLQELSGESFQLRSANTEDEAHVDIRASGFWTPAQEAFFDVRVFHPSAPLHRAKDLITLYKQHENAKKREYSERIREVERAAFTPLVLTTTGSTAKETAIFFKRLADQLADKRKDSYSTIMGWLRCRVSLLYSAQPFVPLMGHGVVWRLQCLSISLWLRPKATFTNNLMLIFWMVCARMVLFTNYYCYIVTL